MLKQITFPTGELARMKASHAKLLIAMLGFADRDGKCWPSYRTLAAVAGEQLAWVQRNLAQMESIEVFSRRRQRNGGFRYTIATRFLRPSPGVSPAIHPAVPTPAPVSPTRAQGYPLAGCIAGDTEGVARKNHHDSYQRGPGDLGRDAPLPRSPEDIAHAEEVVVEAVAGLTGATPDSVRAARVAAAEAYRERTARNKRENLLNGIARAAPRMFRSMEAALQAQQLVEDARAYLDRWKDRPRTLKQAIEQLIRLYQPVRAAAVAA